MRKPGKGTARRALMAAVLLLMSCSGNGQTDRAHRPETDKEANGVITKRYEQIYANPGLNSGQTLAATATGEDITRFTYNDTTVTGGARTVLAVDHRRVLIDYGDVFFAVSLPHKKALGFHLKSNRTYLRLIEAGIFAYVFNFQLVKTTFDRFKEDPEADYFVNGLGDYSELVCLWPGESTFVAGVQNWGNPRDRKRSFALFSKEYSALDNQWNITIDGAVVRPPMASDGTTALLYPGTVALVGLNGQRRDIDSGEFNPLSASFGPDDLLYSIVQGESGPELRVYNLGGEPVWSMPVTVEELAQPPVIGADGTIYLVQKKSVAAIKNHEIVWLEPLWSDQPQATADSAGKLLVADSTRVIAFDPDGEPVWEYIDPDDEVWRTPPIVLDNGAVTAASDKSIVIIK